MPLLQIIVPVAIIAGAILAYHLVKAKPDPYEKEEDPTYDVWHKEFKDIWRKSA